MRFRALALVFCMAMASGCATTTYRFRPGDNRVEVAVQGPLRDLGIVREEPPDILIRAMGDPYALPSGFDCDANLAEIAELDSVLGSDLPLPGADFEEEFIDPPGLIANVISGAIGLPYSSIIRRMTGAAHRDRMLRGAILAGMVRRSFLQGVVLSQGCIPNDRITSPPVETAEPAPPPQPVSDQPVSNPPASPPG